MPLLDDPAASVVRETVLALLPSAMELPADRLLERTRPERPRRTPSTAGHEAAIEMIKKEGRLKPKAIIPVDLFGLAADYEAIMTIAKPYFAMPV